MIPPVPMLQNGLRLTVTNENRWRVRLFSDRDNECLWVTLGEADSLFDIRLALAHWADFTDTTARQFFRLCKTEGRDASGRFDGSERPGSYTFDDPQTGGLLGAWREGQHWRVALSETLPHETFFELYRASPAGVCDGLYNLADGLRAFARALKRPAIRPGLSLELRALVRALKHRAIESPGAAA